MCNFLGERTSVLIVPYAQHNKDVVVARFTKQFKRLGLKATSLHTARDPDRALEKCEALFFCGGNVFRLLKSLYDLQLIGAIRHLVLDRGIPFVGASAGAEVAAPTIHCVNDMPLVLLPSFRALGLIPYHISVHHPEPHQSGAAMREQEFADFHKVHTSPVVALKEGGMLLVEDGTARNVGENSIRIFRRLLPPVDVEPEEVIAPDILRDSA
jgi:dipeptidase E